jgi:uncharacterized protein
MTPAQQLHEAIKKGDASQVAALLDADASLIRGGGASGMAPLLLAIYTHQAAIVDLLLQRGADLDVFAAAALGRASDVKAFVQKDQTALEMNSSDGWSPLHLACFFGHLETAEMLLAQGADVTARSANALHNTPLHAAAAGRHLEICSLLLKAKADPNATQQGGYTPLHAAAANGHDELVRLLLAHQASPKSKSEKGETPADMAKSRGHHDTAATLERLSA